MQEKNPPFLKLIPPPAFPKQSLVTFLGLQLPLQIIAPQPESVGTGPMDLIIPSCAPVRQLEGRALKQELD